MNEMFEMFEWLGYDAPLWVVVILAFFNLLTTLFTTWERIVKLTKWLGNRINRFAKEMLMRLGFKPIVSLTQEEYDALPIKDENTLYAIIPKK